MFWFYDWTDIHQDLKKVCPVCNIRFSLLQSYLFVCSLNEKGPLEFFGIRKGRSRAPLRESALKGDCNLGPDQHVNVGVLSCPSMRGFIGTHLSQLGSGHLWSHSKIQWSTSSQAIPKVAMCFPLNCSN